MFGCQLDHSTMLNDVVDEGAGADSYYMFKFGGRVQIYASHVLVANNAIPVSDKNYKYDQLTSSGSVKTLIFDYGKTFGLDINKSQLNPLNNKINGYLQEDIIIRDNYIFIIRIVNRG